MPEGDSVFRAAARLREALDGRVLVRSDFRVPRHATADLSGRRVLETVSRGKHLLTRVEGGLTVHTHLRMDGSWRIMPPHARVPGRDQVRLVLATADNQAVGFKLGMVDLIRTEREDTVVGHLGPDLLGPDWDAELAARNLMRAPERTIGEALLDQRNLAGIGTIYRAETLFLRGLWPWRTVGEVAELDNLEDVVTQAQRLLAEGARQRVDRRWVYGRAGRPCRRCGGLISRGEMGAAPQERLILWCGTCQPR